MPAKSHGEYGQPIYRIWIAMKQRCYNTKHRSYKNYGGRGIFVCNEWKDNYVSFRDWALNSGYKKGLTIERNDNDKSYNPNNCSWIYLSRQASNTQRTVHITAFGETKPQEHWTYDRRCIVSSRTFRSRLRLGWTSEKAMTTPADFKPLKGNTNGA